jgi:hypothetical protein
MSEVLTPTPGQTIVRTHDAHHDNEYRHILDAILREQAAGFRTAATDHTDTIADIKDSRHDGIEAANRAAAAASLASCKTDDAICAATSALTTAITHGTEKTGDDYALLQKQVSDSATSTLVGFKDLTALSYQIQGASLLEAAKNAAAITVQATANANATSVQATANFNALTVQATANTSAILLDSTKNAAASTLLATQLAATAAAQLAECCCELRAGQIAQADRILAKLNEDTIERLRDRAAKSDAALAAFFAAKVPPVTPVA